MFSIKVADRHTTYTQIQTHRVIDWQ